MNSHQFQTSNNAANYSPMQNSADRIIAERETSHGPYDDTARIAQGIKDVMHAAPNWSKLTAKQKESLDLIASKQARILVGDPNHPDHWHDIAGYAKLVR